MFGKPTREELQETIRQRDVKIEELEEANKSLSNAAVVARETMTTTDAAELTNLREQLAERHADIVRLVGERDTAFSVLELLSQAPEWTPEETPDYVTQLRKWRDVCRALDLRLQFMQAASEAADAHRSSAPWVGEQQRAEAAS
jgi:hypothetical protein